MLNFNDLKIRIENSSTENLESFRREIERVMNVQGSSFRLITLLNTVNKELYNRR